MIAILLFLSGLGTPEIIIIALLILVLFGSKKIPDFARGLGKGIREFKDALKDVKKEVENASNEIPKIKE